MKPRVVRLVLVIFLFVASYNSFAQKNPIPVFTADSLSSGNYKDVFLSFFQLAFENLAGPRKELKFSSNPYALMMKAKPELAVDTSYLKYKALRNLNFAVGLRVDSNFKFNGFNMGVNYAIINKRDYTVYREFLNLVEARNKEFTDMNLGVALKFSELQDTDSVLAEKLFAQWHQLIDDTKMTIDQLDPKVKAELLNVATNRNIPGFKKMVEDNQKVNVKAAMAERYREEKELFKNRLLWTVSVTDTTYNDQFFFSNVVLSTQILKGFSKKLSPNGFEIDVKGYYNFVDDTLQSGRDLKRSLLNVQGGINYVRRHRSTDISFFEFKAAATYKKIFTGAYANELKERFTLLGTLRLRLYEEIWIPLQFEYDPKHGDLFGLISLKFNFTALKKAIGQKMGL
jgi:hypothetical protein